MGRAGASGPSLNSCLNLLRMILVCSLFIKVHRGSGSCAPVRLCPLTQTRDELQSWAGTQSGVVQRRSSAFVNGHKVHASPACDEQRCRLPRWVTLSASNCWPAGCQKVRAYHRFAECKPSWGFHDKGGLHLDTPDMTSRRRTSSTPRQFGSSHVQAGR